MKALAASGLAEHWRRLADSDLYYSFRRSRVTSARFARPASSNKEMVPSRSAGRVEAGNTYAIHVAKYGLCNVSYDRV